MVILSRALIVMLLAWAVGRLIGAVATYHVQRAIEQYKLTHPISEPMSLESKAEGAEQAEVSGV